MPSIMPMLQQRVPGRMHERLVSREPVGAEGPATTFDAGGKKSGPERPLVFAGAGENQSPAAEDLEAATLSVPRMHSR
jgi:hypothetical protein